MIISGDFIALSLGKDFVGFEDQDNPLVIWFNIRNISGLSCYRDHYRLCIDDCHMVAGLERLRTAGGTKRVRVSRRTHVDQLDVIRKHVRGSDAHACQIVVLFDIVVVFPQGVADGVSDAAVRLTVQTYRVADHAYVVDSNDSVDGRLSCLHVDRYDCHVQGIRECRSRLTDARIRIQVGKCVII